MRRLSAVVVASAVLSNGCGQDEPLLVDDGTAGVAGAGGSSESGGAGGAGGAGGGAGAGPQTAAPSCQPAQGAAPELMLEPLAVGIREPVGMAAPPGDATHLYVLERSGRIRVVQAGALIEDAFLDLVDAVDSSYVEKGLLGLAFHPNYAENGRYFVHYTAKPVASQEHGDLVIAEFRRLGVDALRSEPELRGTLLRIPQPRQLHKGGMLAFGSDGMLYIAVGNGGDSVASGDRGDLKGKILRLDVDTGASGYGIPPGNLPGGRPEIWDTGLRNPWRMSFDACTGDLYIADVGQRVWEEINIEPAGTGRRDYGYPQFDGDQCLNEAVYGCDPEGKTEPTLKYRNGADCAVIGGYVYRGHDLPGLRGTYLYADHCSGRFWSARYENGAAEEPPVDLTATLNAEGVTGVSSFGQDARGELYVTVMEAGLVAKIVARR